MWQGSSAILLRSATLHALSTVRRSNGFVWSFRTISLIHRRGSLDIQHQNAAIGSHIPVQGHLRRALQKPRSSRNCRDPFPPQMCIPASERGFAEVQPETNQSYSVVMARRKTRFVVRSGRTGIRQSGSQGESKLTLEREKLRPEQEERPGPGPVWAMFAFH